MKWIKSMILRMRCIQNFAEICTSRCRRKKEVPAWKIIHIGDNWESDVVNAQKAGFQTYYYPQEKKQIIKKHASVQHRRRSKELYSQGAL